MEAPDFTIKPQSLTWTARLINFLLHRVIRLLLWVMRVDYKITNAEIIPKKGPVILACGAHTSLSDALFMIALIKRPYAGIGMSQLLSEEWPWIIRKGFGWLGHIPIDRGNSESGDLAFRSGLHALSYDQMLVAWYHGKQIRRGEDAVWYSGFARFAKETGAPIYLFKIDGADKFWPSHPDDGTASIKDIDRKVKVRGIVTGPINPNDYDTFEEIIEAAKRKNAYLELPA